MLSHFTESLLDPNVKEHLCDRTLLHGLFQLHYVDLYPFVQALLVLMQLLIRSGLVYHLGGGVHLFFCNFIYVFLVSLYSR